MHLPFRARSARIVLAAGLMVGTVLPGAGHVAAADPLVLRAGTTQDLDSMNPFQTALVVGYEAFTLNYDLLVNFGPNLEPVPGFAESWNRVAAADGKSYTWTFKIHPGMKWSDGKPATSEDARWTLQFVLDAVKVDQSVALGYLDPDVKNAGITKVDAPDPETLVVTATDASNRILQMYLPMLPKHIWEKQTLKTIADFKNDPTVVGTGPYQAVEWKTGQFIRFKRNEDYQGKKGAAAEVVIQIFKNGDTMVQALKTGELDYAHGVNAEQFVQLKSEANIKTVAGTANGWTEFGFNSYARGPIKGGGASTKALQDPAFRDALGYAIDKKLLVDRVLGGYGEPGTTQVPPFQVKFHVEPTNPRTFNIDTAKQKLDAAGYKLDASKRRLDKEGKPLNLRLYMPDSDDSYPKVAQFIQSWFNELGIKVTPQVFDSATLTDIELPPEAGGDANKANYDLFIWGWAGNPDPNALLEIFTSGAIGSSSDSNWENKRYDELFKQQNVATSDDERKTLLAEMQNLMYDEAPYHILYYDANLDVYRTDVFAGWQNQPTDNGVPLFGYGSLGYTLLTDAKAEPTAAPSVAAPATGGSGAPAASGGTSAPAAGSGSNTTLILVVLGIVLLVVVVGFLMSRRRRGAVEDE